MKRLLLFNPDHDYALANGGPYYIPPASIRRLAKSLELIPLLWSSDDDMILTSDDRVLSSRSLHEFENRSIALAEVEAIDPWGWDEALRYRLNNLGLNDSILPDHNFMENVRRLSHRRISIKLNEFMGYCTPPQEICRIEDALRFAREHKGCYFKLPWSSGGRGVLATRELNSIQIEEWVKGALKKQKSILAEENVQRQLDFASLWETKDNMVKFEGFSISLCDGRGKYKGNVYGPQEKIIEYIEARTFSFNPELTILQKKFIEDKILPYYEGKIGIDMMADINGSIYPGVEINLRRTMGHVACNFTFADKKKNNFFQNLPLFNIQELQ